MTLSIRKEQLRELRAVPAHEEFKTWLLLHVRTFFRRELAQLDDDAVRTWLAEALDRADSYGIYKSENIVRYVNLEMVLGPSFGDAPEIPWAGNILNAKDISERHKLRVLNLLADGSVRATRRPPGGAWS